MTHTSASKHFLLAALFTGTLSCESAARAEQPSPKQPSPEPVSTAGHVVTAKIKGLRNTDGGVIAYLHNSEDTFPKKFNQAAQRKRLRLLQTTKTTLTFKDVAPGTYALAVVHDENGNGKIDKNFIRLPKEGIGASNVTSGRPSWSTAKFTVGNDKSVTVSMQYFGGKK